MRVPLAAIRDPALVSSALAAALGLADFTPIDLPSRSRRCGAGRHDARGDDRRVRATRPALERHGQPQHHRAQQYSGIHDIQLHLLALMPPDARMDPQPIGRMLTFCLKKFSGSYCRLISLGRGRFGPYTVAAPSAASSSRRQHGFVRQCRADVAEEAQDVECPRQRMDHGTAVIMGPTCWSSYSREAAIPKLPPPPRIAQNRSPSFLGAGTNDAAIGEDEFRSPQIVEGKAELGISQPTPPPSVNPAIPPPWARTLRVATST
jgi:hypothetical protein